MKKPYIKKYGEFLHFKVWLVDGMYIRNQINIGFTNYDHHYHLRSIPKNEFWIDHHTNPKEIRFYIDHLLVEHLLMSKGKSYSEAFTQANKIEKREREKVKLLQTNIPKQPRETLVNKIHKKLIQQWSKGHLKVWVVKGNLVRQQYQINFAEGGHDLVYHFIPKHEIWLDDDLTTKDHKFILLHELHERNLMSRGWAYSDEDKKKSKIKRSAHKSANAVEYYCRHHPEQLDSTLQKELAKNENI